MATRADWLTVIQRFAKIDGEKITLNKASGGLSIHCGDQQHTAIFFIAENQQIAEQTLLAQERFLVHVRKDTRGSTTTHVAWDRIDRITHKDNWHH